MSGSSSTRFGPPPILLIHGLAAVGVLFWLVMIIRAATGEFSSAGQVIAVGVLLSIAHAAISLFASRHSGWTYPAIWVVLVIDSALAIFVDRKALVLALLAVVLLLLTRVRSAQLWFSAQDAVHDQS